METKILLNVLTLYLPLPIFWALFDQQGSRWTFQATQMDGELSFYIIKPDQMQVLNPLLILVFVPLFDTVFYPLLRKIGIRRPLQKMAVGGFLAGISFLLSMMVQYRIDYYKQDSEDISIFWQIPQIVLMSLGEVRKLNFIYFNFVQTWSILGNVFCDWPRVLLHAGSGKHEICCASLLVGEFINIFLPRNITEKIFSSKDDNSGWKFVCDLRRRIRFPIQSSS